jgi:Fanconi-associated nuclease 1
MVEEGTSVLARLHDYNKEVSILKVLLDQNIYRLGKRGAWYDRLALVQMNHLRDGNRRIHFKAALETCVKAIRDPKVHLSEYNCLQEIDVQRKGGLMSL